MFGFFVIIAAMALTIFYFTIDRMGKRSDVDKVIDFLEDLVEMDALRIEIGANCGQKALTKSDPVKTKNKKKKKKDKKRKKNDSEILQLINKIDKKLEKGYTFANISRNHYEKIYKEEILNLYKTSKLKGEAEDSIKEVLESLLGDLRKPGESFANKLETKASIDTLDTMLTTSTSCAGSSNDPSTASQDATHGRTATWQTTHGRSRHHTTHGSPYYKNT